MGAKGIKRLLLALGLLLAAGVLRADNTGQLVQAVNQQTSIFNGMFKSLSWNFLYGCLNAMETGVWMLWLALTWTVVKLYGAIGSYLIPLWDFSNSGALLQGAETDWGNSASVVRVVGVPGAVSQMVWALVPFVVGLCAILMVALTVQSGTKQVLRGQEPFSAGGGLVIGVGLLVAFPIMYSGSIIFGNSVARNFYDFAMGDPSPANPSGGVVSRYENQQAALGFSTGLFAVLVKNSIFPPDASAQAAAPPSSLQQSMVNSSADLQQIFTTSMNNAEQGNIVASHSLVYDMTMASLELWATRIVQIVLCIAALLEIIALLMLKGGQIIAVFLNFYLGMIACAFYVSPSTRQIFFNWLRAHITVCMWGFFWALLIVVIHIITLAGDALQGMTPASAVTGYAFQTIGLFMMPFILFAGLKKFHEVGKLADSLAMTGAMAAGIGVAVGRGFSNTWSGGVPTGVSTLAGKGPASFLSGKAAGFLGSAGASWANGAASTGALVKTGLGMIPGVGPAAAMAAGAATNAVAGAGKAASKGAAMLPRAHNPLHHRVGMKVDRVQQPRVKLPKAGGGAPPGKGA